MRVHTTTTPVANPTTGTFTVTCMACGWEGAAPFRSEAVEVSAAHEKEAGLAPWAAALLGVS